MRAFVVVLTIVVVIVSISTLYAVENNVSDGSCNIAVLPVEGVVLPYYGLADFQMVVTPEGVERFMDAAEEDDNIEAVLVEVNSPGGTPVASERISERFRNSSLPVVGLVGDVGASGGYMLAASTDYLIASPMSSVGSIGVNASYVEESMKNEEEGLTYVQLTTGQFKDTGTPNRPITEEERDLLQSDLEILHNRFIDIIAKYRDMDRAAVEAVADGSSMPGQRALDNGLVDSLGGRAEARGVFSTILDIPLEEVSFCEPETGVFPF